MGGESFLGLSFGLMIATIKKKTPAPYRSSQALSLSRYETDGVLKRHGVEQELIHEEFRSQVTSLGNMRRK